MVDCKIVLFGSCQCDRSRPPFVQVARIRQKYDCFAVYPNGNDNLAICLESELFRVAYASLTDTSEIFFVPARRTHQPRCES